MPSVDSPFAVRPRAALLAVAIGTFMSTLDGTIVNVALPTMATGFDADLPYAQWVVSGYLLIICCTLPLFGRLGDSLGRRRFYAGGFLLFGAASFFCGAADSMEGLVFWRVVQGLGGAMLMANGPGIVALAFPGAGRGRAFGVMGSAVALGSLAGPALGGALLNFFDWRAIFYVNIPVAAAGACCAWKCLPSREETSPGGFDPAGLALFAVGMTALLMGLSHGRDWPPTLLAACGLGALAAFVLFMRVEKKAAFPMIDLALMSHPPFFSALAVSFLCFTAIFSNAILLPFYLHDILGVSPLALGGTLAVLPLVMAVVAPASGVLSEKTSLPLLAGLGLCAIAAGLANQALLGASSPLWRAALGQVLLGLGVGVFVSPNNNSILSSAPASKSGLAGSILALIRNVGMVSGVAVAAGVFETARRSFLAGAAAPTPEQTVHAFMAGFRCALFTGAALALAAALLAFSRGRKRG